MVKANRIFCNALVMKEKEPDEEMGMAYYEALSRHIKLEHERIGGENWVVSEVAAQRKCRDVARRILGSKCFFVTLSLSEAAQRQRLEKRYSHFGNEQREKMITYQMKQLETFEPAASDEPNARHILITPDMDKNDVVQKILEIVKSF